MALIKLAFFSDMNHHHICSSGPCVHLASHKINQSALACKIALPQDRTIQAQDNLGWKDLSDLSSSSKQGELCHQTRLFTALSICGFRTTMHGNSTALSTPDCLQGEKIFSLDQVQIYPVSIYAHCFLYLSMLQKA